MYKEILKVALTSKLCQDFPALYLLTLFRSPEYSDSLDPFNPAQNIGQDLPAFLKLTIMMISVLPSAHHLSSGYCPF